ncbi:MAG TPA: hypothetical protein VFH73_25620 [Polyangia bacterium]|jgi:prepilin-type processing-associated H-X9-DG protein|nr:hypothetical protein [Polyangia bacterium]
MVFALLALIGGACGGASNSEVKPDASAGTGGSASGSGGASSGTGGSAGGSGGSSSGSGGSSGTTGSGGTVGTDGGGTGGVVGMDGGGNNCPAQTAFTLGVHIILDVTWPATTASAAGTGKVHLWNRAKFTATGTSLVGETSNCGTSLPEFALSFGGQVVTGGSKVSIDVPNTVWDAPMIPKFPNSGTISSWNAGGMIEIVPTVALVGLTMPDPKAMWPASYTGIMAVDHDGDGKPGFTAVPRDDRPYTAPPTALGLFGSAPTADRIYLASRTVVALSGKLDSCNEQSGTANVAFFDSHVVGCRLKGGTTDCNAAQIDFVDQGRTKYEAKTGTFKSKKVADNATCADVRAAFPM